MGLYACGEKIAAAVGARRAGRMLRHWPPGGNASKRVEK